MSAASPSPAVTATPPAPTASTNTTSPPPSPPPNSTSPPPSVSPPPPESSPPPVTPPAPPPAVISPPPTQSPPPPPPLVTPSPPPLPQPVAPASQPPPPPPTQQPPVDSPPPPENSSPPPPLATPPTISPPPPPHSQYSNPPKTSASPPPPPSADPPQTSPPPAPPNSSPPPPENSPPPQITAPSSQPSPPSSNSTQNSTPPPPPPSVIRLSPPPPPPSLVSPGFSENSPPPSASGTDSSKGSTSSGIGNGAVVAISVGAVVIGIVLIGILTWCFIRRKKKRGPESGSYVMPSTSGSIPESDSSLFKSHSSAPLIQSGSGSDTVYTPSSGGLGNSRAWFAYEELVKVTNNFAPQNLLGEGGFGSVYKGCLPDGREIAVKQLNIGGGQGEREFKAEVEIISRIHHRHLVSLVGYCILDDRRLLVYDYVPNKTLYHHLHEGMPVLSWEKRVKIAAGAARGIAYLHEDCNPRIIHRDIKSSNILLDYNFDAQVSDFGLAKLTLDAVSHISTRVMGTFGYVAPEYASSGRLTDKSDVFSFGVVLLELITGRKPVDASQPMGDESLVEWARPLLSHAIDNEEFEGLTDPKLERNYVESEMFRMIEIAATCVRHSAAKRPRMGQVVRAFDSIINSDLNNGMRPGESEAFDSAEMRMFRRMAFGSQDYSTDFFSQNSFNST